MALINSVIKNSYQRFAKQQIAANLVRLYSDEPIIYRIDRCPGREQIGFGLDGEKAYYDRCDFPCPAVRYKPETPEIKSLRSKEKGDWRSLSIDEKKQLYRASFRLTFAEIDAPTGRGKSYIGWACFFAGVGLWVFMAFYYARNRGTRRESLSLEGRQATLQKLIAIKLDPIDGLASKWDYEKDEWKS